MATARVERRLSAILAADVVGYSRLMERDEAGTFERLKRLRKDLIEPILARYSGRFVDLKGDGAIVEFGSVVSAVEAAVEIQRAMRPGSGPTRGRTHPLPDRDQSWRCDHRWRHDLRRWRQRGGADRVPVRAGRGVAVTQRLQPGQRQGRPWPRPQRPAPGQEHQRGGRDFPGGAGRRGASRPDRPPRDIGQAPSAAGQAAWSPWYSPPAPGFLALWAATQEKPSIAVLPFETWMATSHCAVGERDH